MNFIDTYSNLTIRQTGQSPHVMALVADACMLLTIINVLITSIAAVYRLYMYMGVYIPVLVYVYSVYGNQLGVGSRPFYD